MTRYALACGNHHDFEGWFGSSGDFERQREDGLLECPFCGSHDVTKTLMAPMVSTSRSRQGRGHEAPVDAAGQASHDQAVQDQAGPDQAASGVQLAGLSARQREIVARMRELKTQLIASAEDVGERFSEEARKIHYGETEKRGIYGKASLDEAADLAEEGIDFLPLPDLPEDRN